MRKKIFCCLTGIALAGATLSERAQSASVATVPTGMITCAIPHGATSYLSLPLTTSASYTSAVTAVTSNTISVGDSPAPFTTNLATPSAPYFVKFLSGGEKGRVLLISSNSTSTLTLDITDNSPQTVNLTTTGFSVAAGDTFEIFPAETIASVFGDNSPQHPLTLNGGNTAFKADCVSLYSTSMSRWCGYFFNTAEGCWQKFGTNVNGNNTILYPYGAIAITRRVSTTDASLVMAGRVAEVPCITKTAGNSTPTYSSTGYASDMTLSQLQFGSAWVTGTSALAASTISVWNATLSRFDSYYELPDSTWRKNSDPTTDQSHFVLGAGSAIAILQRTALAGAASFLPSVMPYSLK